MVRTDLQRNVWYDPGARPERPRLRVAARVGAFRGFGGVFAEPPRVAPAPGAWLTLTDEGAWHLIVDACGATFHRAEMPERERRRQPPSATGPMDSDCRERCSGVVVKSSISAILDPDQPRPLSSDGSTLAVTGDGTHAVVLIALT